MLKTLMRFQLLPGAEQREAFLLTEGWLRVEWSGSFCENRVQPA